MSAFGGKADIERDPSQCPLLTQSGHSQSNKIQCNIGILTSLWALIMNISNSTDDESAIRALIGAHFDGLK